MNDLTPARTIRETWRWFPAAAVVLLAVMILGGGTALLGWQMDWWFASHNATRQAQNIQNGYANQTTLREEITRNLAQVDTITVQIAAAGHDTSLAGALKVQRMSIAGTACYDAAQISGTPLPAQQAEWVSANCADGTVSSDSTYYQTGQP